MKKKLKENKIENGRGSYLMYSHQGGSFVGVMFGYIVDVTEVIRHFLRAIKNIPSNKNSK